MQHLATMLSAYKVPERTRAEWDTINAECERFEQELEAADRERRAKGAGIPRGFASADIAQCNEAVQTWAAHPGEKGLLLQGEVGRGKTFAACAILVDLSTERTVRFVTMDDLLRQIKATFSGQDTEQAVLDRYANVGVLCLDDVGKERLTEWSLPIFFSIIDRRYRENRPTIITTNYTGRVLLDRFTVNDDTETAKAIASRLSQFERIVFDGHDRRMTQAVS